jgi:predicted acetyltransferase
MQEVVRELHAKGVALSTLYPATQPLYRRAGYEQAGSHFRVRVETARLFAEDRGPVLRRAVGADAAAIERMHRAEGREHPGCVDRSELFWSFVREVPDETVHAFVVEEDGDLTGYVYYTSKTNEHGRQDLVLRDVVARTAPAARRLLTFFRDHRSQVDRIQWRGSPAHPLLLHAREQRHEVRLWDVWMLSITHLEAALETRGYPEGVRAEVHLELEDPLCEGNAGRHVLRVEGGRGTLTPGGAGDVALDARALAPLYTGFVSPWQLRSAGRLACGDEDASTLAALFAGPTPWMQDGF